MSSSVRDGLRLLDDAYRLLEVSGVLGSPHLASQLRQLSRSTALQAAAFIQTLEGGDAEPPPTHCECSPSTCGCEPTTFYPVPQSALATAEGPPSPIGVPADSTPQDLRSETSSSGAQTKYRIFLSRMLPLVRSAMPQQSQKFIFSTAVTLWNKHKSSAALEEIIAAAKPDIEAIRSRNRSAMRSLSVEDDMPPLEEMAE
jgi:hypothetical protein